LLAVAIVLVGREACTVSQGLFVQGWLLAVDTYFLGSGGVRDDVVNLIVRPWGL